MPTPATHRQAKALSALAERQASNHAYTEDAWLDTDLAEKVLNRTKSWRAYRRINPR
jgi:hypothetical protein